MDACFRRRAAHGGTRPARSLAIWAVLVAGGCDRSVRTDDCPNACTVDASRCEPDGLVSRCQEAPSEGGCPEWGTPEPCPGEAVCVDNACGCLDPCSLGHAVCASETERRFCQGPDADGCYAWGPPEPCPEGSVCEGGSCCDGDICDCGQFCDPGETACSPSDDSLLLTCVGPDEDGCMFWEETNCGAHQTCRAGACDCVADCVPCAEGCSEGACDVRCDGDAVVACSGPDEDGCTYWADTEPCEPGLVCEPDVGPAQVAICIEPIPPNSDEECAFEGQKVCPEGYPTRYRECYIDPDDGSLKLDCGT